MYMVLRFMDGSFWECHFCEYEKNVDGEAICQMCMAPQRQHIYPGRPSLPAQDLVSAERSRNTAATASSPLVGTPSNRRTSTPAVSTAVEPPAQAGSPWSCPRCTHLVRGAQPQCNMCGCERSTRGSSLAGGFKGGFQEVKVDLEISGRRQFQFPQRTAEKVVQAVRGLLLRSCEGFLLSTPPKDDVFPRNWRELCIGVSGDAAAQNLLRELNDGQVAVQQKPVKGKMGPASQEPIVARSCFAAEDMRLGVAMDEHTVGTLQHVPGPIAVVFEHNRRSHHRTLKWRYHQVEEGVDLVFEIKLNGDRQRGMFHACEDSDEPVLDLFVPGTNPLVCFRPCGAPAACHGTQPVTTAELEDDPDAEGSEGFTQKQRHRPISPFLGLGATTNESGGREGSTLSGWPRDPAKRAETWRLFDRHFSDGNRFYEQTTRLVQCVPIPHESPDDEALMWQSLDIFVFRFRGQESVAAVLNSELCQTSAARTRTRGGSKAATDAAIGREAVRLPKVLEEGPTRELLHETMRSYLGIDKLPFEIAWRLKGLVSCQVIPAACGKKGVNLKSEVVRALKPDAVINKSFQLNDSGRTQRLAGALDTLAGDQRCRDSPLAGEKLNRALSEAFSLHDAFQKSRRAAAPAEELRQNCSLVGTVTVTPTKVYCRGPQVETSNRVLNEFPRYQHFFLRVKFKGEGAYRGWREPRHLDKCHVEKRLEAIVRHGLPLYGRVYRMIGYSNSQKKEGGCWFLDEKAEVEGVKLTREDVMQRIMGALKFADMNPSKLMKRYGLGFTTAQQVGNRLSEGDFLQVKDVQDPSGKYTFTDGCGRIDPEFMEQVLRELGRNASSAIQVRLMGCKGMLLAHPMLEPGSHRIEIPDSMWKFDGPLTHLGVTETASFIPLHLNRQVLMILNHLKIPDKVFERKQRKMIEKLTSTDLEATQEMLYLHTSNPEDNDHRRMDWPATLLDLLDVGFSVDEPFLRATLSAMRSDKLHDLKAKARIGVQEGAILYGVADPQGELQYGECVVQVMVPGHATLGRAEGRRKSRKVPRTVTGWVAVARVPCHHPGDIRVLKAVQPPAYLAHAYDVVVFPTQGARPHPDEMAGGDLDGDQYYVIYDKELVPELCNVCEPADYSGDKQVKEQCDLTAEMVETVFIESFEKDQIGILSNEHLKLAERDGLDNPVALDLAKELCKAHDLVTTGASSSSSKLLRQSHRPRTYVPDFMAKEGMHSYESSHIIGKLYREVVGKIREYSAAAEASTQADEEAFHAELVAWLTTPRFKGYMEDATKMCKMWERKLSVLASSAGDGVVIEPINVFAGTYGSEIQYEDIQKLKERMRALRKEFRDVFQSSLSPDPEGTKRLYCNHLNKASAWFHAAYSSPSAPNVQKSFAWIHADLLLEIKVETVGTGPKTQKPPRPFEYVGPLD
ncbi:hypothetical protein CYMTET_10370 [Cymbomonas tetramitiformis]|uniref:RNA-dependent RNA polymerase n=1 Tax=Cymbomonas tetramitiformis TaxID=36881 RepID=A0AAE0GPT2_9CHLO|nr:hypothetical protein CYMTET_10370 [Cymbomonas tetramitiformis]